MRIWSCQRTRKLDRLAVDEYGMSGLVLMENAGRGCVDVLEKAGVGGPVLICCGPGNNGGDGFVMARHLELRGHLVRVLLCASLEKLRGDAEVNYRVLELGGSKPTMLAELPAPELDALVESSAWVVDALVGTGAHGPLRAPMDGLVERLNRADAVRLAVDVPSGLNADTGVAEDPVFLADHTCTLAAVKPGLLEPGARRAVGVLHVVDIGVPRSLLERVDRWERDDGAE